MSGVTVDDEVIQGMITGVSGAIMRETSRNLLTQSYTKTFNGKGQIRFFLPDAPVTAVASLKVNGTTWAAAADSEGQGYLFDEESVYLVNAGIFWRGFQNIVIAYTAGYDPASTDWVHMAAIADLKEACARQVVHEYKRREQESDRSKTLGGGETVTFIVDDFLPAVRQTIERFKRPVTM